MANNFKITLVGRTNVGKSTLFNRITKTRSALTFDRPGVTRDSKEYNTQIYDKKITLIDIPGMFDYAECDNKPELMNAITQKVMETIKDSDLIVFVIDGVIGVTAKDKEICSILRKFGKHVVVAVNKSEKQAANMAYADAMEFGFDNIVSIAAEHGLGIDDLYEVIYEKIPNDFKIIETDQEEKVIDEEVIKLAIIGRPNVGKSTLVNQILKENKQLVANFAGLTRQSSEIDFEYQGRKLKLIDTPGLRRKAKISDILEQISGTTSRKSYRSADAVILLIDASSLECGEIEKQDLALASDILKSKKALVIGFNKYDQTPYKKDDIPEFLKRNFARGLYQLKEVPFLFLSALRDVNVAKLLESVITIYDKQKKRISTSKLNDWLFDINKSDILQSASSKFKIKYVTQVSSVPPTFILFVNKTENIRDDYKRFIENNLKKAFDLNDISVEIIFKQKTDKQKRR